MSISAKRRALAHFAIEGAVMFAVLVGVPIIESFRSAPNCRRNSHVDPAPVPAPSTRPSVAIGVGKSDFIAPSSIASIVGDFRLS